MNEMMKIAVAAKIINRSKRQPESRLQESCVNWFRYQYRGAVLFAIPNGGRRDAREAAHMKRTGVLAGVPDLCLAVSRNHYAGMFIEMKAGKNTETDRQVDVRKKLTAAGYRCVVCRSFDEFRSEVEGYMEGMIPQGPLYRDPRERNEAKDAVRQLFERVQTLYGYTEKDIRSNRKPKNLAFVRMAMAYILCEVVGLSVRAVADIMNRDRATIFYYTKQVSTAATYNKELAVIYANLKQTTEK